MFRTYRKKITSGRYAQRFAKWIIFTTARLFGINLILECYHKKGILNYQSDEESGEKFFVQEWLPAWFRLRDETRPVLMDVGANLGHYSKSLAKSFPSARIHAFEPHPGTFRRFAESLPDGHGIELNQCAVGAEPGQIELYGSTQGDDSEHSSLYADVLSSQHHYEQIVATTVPIIDLESYTRARNISRIHFLKIDTEGHEYDTIKGCGALLAEGGIDLIQFEFNEMNIISRKFLRDFFELLGNYNLYRLLPDRLKQVKYSSAEEIFLFQNLIAISKDLDSRS